MSLTVRIKEIDSNEYADVEIPTEWKDMTLEWYVDLLQIIKKHTKAAETKEKYLEEAYIDSEFYEKIIEDAEFFNETLLNQDIFSFIYPQHNYYDTKFLKTYKLKTSLNPRKLQFKTDNPGKQIIKGTYAKEYDFFGQSYGIHQKYFALDMSLMIDDFE